MRLTSPRDLIAVVAVIAGLVGATALVAGYVERPGQTAAPAAAESGCGDCLQAKAQACGQGECQHECGPDACADCTQPDDAAPAPPAGCPMKTTGDGCDPIGCPFSR